MRALLLTSVILSALAIFPVSGHAGNAHPGGQVAAISDGDKVQPDNSSTETYRGYFFDLSEIAGQPNFAVIADALRHQIDIVESVRLSPRVLKFFHTVPIVVDEFACLSSPNKDHPKVLAAACYDRAAPGPSPYASRKFWNSEKLQWTTSDAVPRAEDAQRGVVLVRPLMLDSQHPVLLHELLHAYHANILPEGIKDPAVKLHYDFAKGGQLYPADAYLLTNEKEFFAVTASVFLYGKDGPFTRSALKEKQPDYYKYLVWLFGFDPDRATPSVSPVASVE